METLEKTKIAVFDKTGTLTRGTFEVTDVHPSGVSVAELLDIAACAEAGSDHPIALSIVRAHGGHIDKSRISSVREIAGMGIEAVIDGKKILAGNTKLVPGGEADCPDCSGSGTVIHVSADGEYVGHIVISDTVKPDSASAVAQLRRLGVERVVMLTGDGAPAANAAAEAVGITEVKHSLLPADKVAAVEALSTESGGATVFVGDGINDAPALVAADAGIAMGVTGSDIAVDTADVVLMDDSVTKVAEAIDVSRRTLRIVRENIAFSLIVKLAIMATGALGISNMWWAVFGDVGVTVLAVLNGMRMMIGSREKR